MNNEKLEDINDRLMQLMNDLKSNADASWALSSDPGDVTGHKVHVFSQPFRSLNFKYQPSIQIYLISSNNYYERRVSYANLHGVQFWYNACEIKFDEAIHLFDENIQKVLCFYIDLMGVRYFNREGK